MRYIMFLTLIFLVLIAGCTTQTPISVTTTPTPDFTTLPTTVPSPIPPTNRETSSLEKSTSNSLNEKKPVTISLPFTGTTWILKTYQGSDGRMVDVVPTTRMVRVIFDAGGNLTGFDGCNGHSGSYTLIGQNGISIKLHGPMTLMYCFNREAPYRSLLSTASSYEMTPNGILNLKDADGTVVLVYYGQ